jgi:hypothetical protein
MNKLSAERAKVVNRLIEGCYMRSTVRLTGVAKKTLSRILVETGEACAAFHDKIMRNLPCKVIQELTGTHLPAIGGQLEPILPPWLPSSILHFQSSFATASPRVKS